VKRLSAFKEEPFPCGDLLRAGYLSTNNGVLRGAYKCSKELGIQAIKAIAAPQCIEGNTLLLCETKPRKCCVPTTAGSRNLSHKS